MSCRSEAATNSFGAGRAVPVAAGTDGPAGLPEEGCPLGRPADAPGIPEEAAAPIGAGADATGITGFLAHPDIKTTPTRMLLTSERLFIWQPFRPPPGGTQLAGHGLRPRSSRFVVCSIYHLMMYLYHFMML